ncbi:hypothetical protein ACRJBZ_003512 [Vibrio fluvialis]|uniref:hypothetical protein n=1 Tax=Vibrio fluvialis TaxID=676 RepID=UPI000CEB769C|nr:hypothetical protein [Vibrio fluvialis]AVH34061.1 hypothetical protein AL475_19440 [Vibrio fluvialis]EKO3957585.1 hypothetical protein [Vibrio fluvialis]
MKYHTNTVGGDPEGFKKGLGHALTLALKDQSKQLLIKVGSLQNTKGIMSDVLGDKFVNSLIKTKEQTISIQGTNVTIYLEGDKTHGSNFSGGTVFTPWVASHSLASALNDHRTTALVYVPWMQKELNDYIKSNPNSVLI